MATPHIPGEEEVLSYFDSLSNWGRWGNEDQLGTLNLVNDAKRAQAAALVQHGITVGCARPLSTSPAADVAIPALHFMMQSGETHCLPCADERNEREVSTDFIGMGFHGLTITHIDALCHIFWDKNMYNGRSADLVTTSRGALAEVIEVLKDGIVTRGVLLDITKVRGKEWLEARRGRVPGRP